MCLCDLWFVCFVGLDLVDLFGYLLLVGYGLWFRFNSVVYLHGF